MGFLPFNPKHALIGFATAIIGWIGLGEGWLGLFGKFLFPVIVLLGAVWAVLPGGLGPLTFYLVKPFAFLNYVLFLPIKKRGDKIYDDRNPVIAYWMRDDRIVLVTYYCIDNTIGGRSVFRGRRKLARMREILDSANVPEYPVVEEQLKDSVEVWNQDTELRRQVEERRKIGRRPSEALIVLDEHSKERVDRIYETIDFLWDSEKYQDMRQEIIQLAIWYSLAVDVCYGEKRGFQF